MWKQAKFEYTTEDDKGEHIWYVTINYQEGYQGNKTGSYDASYEDLPDEYEIAKVETEVVFSYDITGMPVYDFAEIAIDEDTEKELIEYYIEQQEELANDY